MLEPLSKRRLYLWRSILILFLLYYYSAHQICAAKDNNNMLSFAKSSNHNGGDDDVAAVAAVVQLFLVRHGETEGNKLGLTLGQSDSPLTRLGERQAQALGETPWIQDTHFWRIYSSDLSRAEKTTRLILQSRSLANGKRKNNNVNDGDNLLPLVVVQLDARLREMSKGVKQGLPKTLTYGEAYELHQRQTPNKEIPFLETVRHGWNRIRAFIDQVIRDAVIDAMMQQKEQCNDNNDPSDGIHTITTDTSLPSEEKLQATNHHHHTTNNNNKPPDPYKVLIVSHSAILRIFLRRLLGEERLKKHPDARFDGDGNFYLPNTSLTILEIRARVSSSRGGDDDDDEDDYDGSSTTIRVEPLAESAENVDIVQLTWADHEVRMSSGQEMQFANNGE